MVRVVRGVDGIYTKDEAKNIKRGAPLLHRYILEKGARMNSLIPKECYDCHISARIRKQMLNVTNIDSMAKLQTYLRQLCNKCNIRKG